MFSGFLAGVWLEGFFLFTEVQWVPTGTGTSKAELKTVCVCVCVYLRQPVVLKKMSDSEGLSSILSWSSGLERGIRILSVNSGRVSRASLSFRLSFEDRFHRIPTGRESKREWGKEHGNMSWEIDKNLNKDKEKNCNSFHKFPKSNFLAKDSLWCHAPILSGGIHRG